MPLVSMHVFHELRLLIHLTDLQIFTCIYAGTRRDGARPLSEQTNMVTEAHDTANESEEVLNGGTLSPSIVSVQEMVRCNLPCIPDRFERSEENKPEILTCLFFHLKFPSLTCHYFQLRMARNYRI